MAKLNKSKFIEEEMQVAENDLDKIRYSPLMYISRVGSLGAIHLAKEGINNSIDECLNENSPGENIYMVLNEDTNTFSVEDDGRGLPFDRMLDACTKIQSSTKFGRTSNQKSAGQNGLGIKATNALSEYFKLEVYKLGEYAVVEFKEGVQTQDGKVKACKDKKRHGTILTFKPSEKYMGKCQMKADDLLFWLNNIKHFLDKNITMELEVIKKNKKVRHTFSRSKNGIGELVNELSPKNHTSIVRASGVTKVDEDVRIIKPGGKVENKIISRDVELEFAFALNAEQMEMKTRSFCNFVHTIDEGDHTNAVVNAVCDYLSRKTRDILTEKEKDKYNILYNDITNSLIIALTVNTSLDPGFTGQTKEKIENSQIIKPLKEIVKSQLNVYFTNNPKDLKTFTNVIKANAKARYEANKSRNSIIKREVSVISEHLIPNYFPANNKGKKDYRELFIFEGLSVKSNGTQARDADYQAMYTMRGVPGELYSAKTSEIDKNETFKNLTRAINGGVGESFDVNKSRFDKVIITSDGDVDGFFIFSLLGGFFLKHMTDLILDGRLYLSVPPLYKIKDSKTPFVTDKEQYQAVYFRRIIDKYQLKEKKGKILNRKEMLDFLNINKYYVDELTRCKDHYSANPKLIEYIVKYKDDKNFKKNMKKLFPEINIEYDRNNKKDMIIEGVYEGAYQIFTVDEQFEKKTEKLRDLMDKNNEQYYYVIEDYKGKNAMDRGYISIGEFLQSTIKLQPSIELRYKGLGELDENDMWMTVMNPETRTLIQLTVDDVEKACQTYDTLHGKGKVNAENRREMTDSFEINMEMLDN
jgi:DNA gyrase subunit B